MAKQSCCTACVYTGTCTWDNVRCAPPTNRYQRAAGRVQGLPAGRLQAAGEEGGGGRPGAAQAQQLDLAHALGFIQCQSRIAVGMHGVF